MYYYQVVNPGTKDWISHEDNEYAYIGQYGPDIWATENSPWAQRVGATELTKVQAQAILDAYTDVAIAEWQACVSGSTPWFCGPKPTYTILPD